MAEQSPWLGVMRASSPEVETLLVFGCLIETASLLLQANVLFVILWKITRSLSLYGSAVPCVPP